jgi:hypothetical protein
MTGLDSGEGDCTAPERSIHKMGLSPLSLYALVLLSAVAHAAWNALVRSAGDRPLMMGAIRLVGLTYRLVMLPFVRRRSAVTCMWLAFATAAVFAYYGLLIHSDRIVGTMRPVEALIVR